MGFVGFVLFIGFIWFKGFRVKGLGLEVYVWFRSQALEGFRA